MINPKQHFKFRKLPICNKQTDTAQKCQVPFSPRIETSSKATNSDFVLPPLPPNHRQYTQYHSKYYRQSNAYIFIPHQYQQPSGWEKCKNKHLQKKDFIRVFSHQTDE